MEYISLIITAVLTLVLGVGGLFFVMQQGKGKISRNLKKLRDEFEEKQKFCETIRNQMAQTIQASQLQSVFLKYRSLENALKAERGRITITEAERETVEIRLRELEEIERELEASALETKEEVKILEKKVKDLKKSNDELKAKIAHATSRIDTLIDEIEFNAEMKEQIMAMKTELVNTEEKIDTLLVQIEEGNEQYFILKERYDALDIEYAQLYEKFAAEEGGD